MVLKYFKRGTLLCYYVDYVGVDLYIVYKPATEHCWVSKLGVFETCFFSRHAVDGCEILHQLVTIK